MFSFHSSEVPVVSTNANVLEMTGCCEKSLSAMRAIRQAHAGAGSKQRSELSPQHFLCSSTSWGSALGGPHMHELSTSLHEAYVCVTREGRGARICTES